MVDGPQMVPDVLSCDGSFVLGHPLRDPLQERPVVFNLRQGEERPSPRCGQFFFDGMEHDPRRLSASLPINILGIRMKDEGQVVRHVDPLSVHRHDQFHEVVEKGVNGRPVEGVPQRNVKILGIEKGKAVMIEREKGFHSGQNNHISFIQ